MIMFGIDPATPAAVTLSKNLDPLNLIRFALDKADGIMGQLKTVLGTPTTSQIAFFTAPRSGIVDSIQDLAWALETIDTAITSAQWRSTFSSDAVSMDQKLDVIFEDLANAAAMTGAVGVVASKAMILWQQMKQAAPDGSACITLKETRYRGGTEYTAASRTPEKFGILPKSAVERAARQTYMAQVYPGGFSPVTLQYAVTGGAPSGAAKKTNPLMLAGIAVAGYFAYKSLT